MAFRRARKEEQIAQRGQEILSIARTLCDELGVLGWSLNELGRRTSITKSNLYRYFSSREEVLLQLLANELEEFVADFDRMIGTRRLDTREFSAVLAAEYTKRSFLCELLAVGPAVLEHNILTERAIEIKRPMMQLGAKHTATFCRALAGMDADQAAWVSSAIAIHVAGLWPIANPSSAIQELQKRPEFCSMTFDFEPSLNQLIETLLVGCQSSSRIGVGREPEPAGGTDHALAQQTKRRTEDEAPDR